MTILVAGCHSSSPVSQYEPRLSLCVQPDADDELLTLYDFIPMEQRSSAVSGDLAVSYEFVSCALIGAAGRPVAITRDYRWERMRALVTSSGGLTRHEDPDNPGQHELVELPSASLFELETLADDNLLHNGNFATWQRAEARSMPEPSTFRYVGPTLGDLDSYDGMGGRRVSHADMWHGKQWGAKGGGEFQRRMASGTMVDVTPETQYYLNWKSQPVEPTRLSCWQDCEHFCRQVTGEPVPEYCEWFRGDCVPGVGGEVPPGCPDAPDWRELCEVQPLTSYVPWDPGCYEHVDSDLRYVEGDPRQYPADPDCDQPAPRNCNVQLRSGTAGQELSQRIPVGRFRGGMYTIRIRARARGAAALSETPWSGSHNSSFTVHVRQSYGEGRSVTTDTHFPGIRLTEEIQDYILIAELPPLGDGDLSQVPDSAFLSLGIESRYPHLPHDVDIFSVSLRRGISTIPNDHRAATEELSYLQQFYRPVRVGRIDRVDEGHYYAAESWLEPAMYGAPWVSHLEDLRLEAMDPPYLESSREDGFRVRARAREDSDSGQFSSVFEAEYQVGQCALGTHGCRCHAGDDHCEGELECLDARCVSPSALPPDLEPPAGGGRIWAPPYPAP